MEKDVIVVGCGFSGAVCARKLADNGKRVVIIEKRSHIAGNMYDSYDSQGILIHNYGPHIFHTNNEEVFAFIKPFSAWYKYEHRVLGNIGGILVPIPFNYKSIESLFEKKEADTIKKLLNEHFGSNERVSVLDLINSKEPNIKEFGRFVYNNVFARYTAKQWGVPFEKVNQSVINRVPILLGYDDRYFQDKIQMMPQNGFTELFKNLLDHKNILVRTSIDSKELISHKDNKIYFEGDQWDKPIVYTGAIDEFFDYRFGRLPYISLDLRFEQKKITTFQPAAVVNYTISEKYTRITEFKYLTKQIIKNKSTILKEYPREYSPNENIGNIPYYPIIEEKNIILYNKYKNLAKKLGNMFLCGRLANYGYYNMDAAIEKALDVAEMIINDKKDEDNL
ncbi:MAG: UDP-galactopyranose mutase [bacterium]